MLGLGAGVMLALGVAGCGGGSEEGKSESPTSPNIPGKTPITGYHYETIPTYLFPNHWRQEGSGEQGVKACHDGVHGTPDSDDRLVFDTGDNKITALTADINGQGTWSFYFLGEKLRHFIGTLSTTERIKVREATPEEVRGKIGRDVNTLTQDDIFVFPGALGGKVVFDNGVYFVNELPDSVCGGVKTPTTTTTRATTTTTTGSTTTTTLPPEPTMTSLECGSAGHNVLTDGTTERCDIDDDFIYETTDTLIKG